MSNKAPRRTPQIKWIQPWLQKIVSAPKLLWQKTTYRRSFLLAPFTQKKRLQQPNTQRRPLIYQDHFLFSTPQPLERYQINLLLGIVFCFLLTVVYIFFQLGRLIGLLEVLIFGADDIVRSIFHWVWFFR